MGVTKNGFQYSIEASGKVLTVYCDFKTEPGMAWTLVMSWSFQYKNLPAFRSSPIMMNAPFNDRNPNLEIYRLTLAYTRALKAQSTHWKATCSFQYINDAKTLYRDYIRGNFRDFDIMTFSGYGICRKIEYVNIRGNAGYSTTAKFWQVVNLYTLHIDSPSTGWGFNAVAGSVPSEDNFGFYGRTSTNSPAPTTRAQPPTGGLKVISERWESSFHGSLTSSSQTS